MNWKITLGGVLMLAVLAAVWWVWWGRIHPTGPDCSMLSHEKTSGIDFSFTINKVKALQGTLGLTDKDVRDFDDLLKDYGAKYEAICRDYSALHTISTAEYNCRRDNMDRTLDNVRALRETLGKASGNTANSIAKSYIETILNAGRSSFKGGCGASLRINPEKIRMSKEISHTISLFNIGNRDVNFGVTGIPECLLADPKAGELKQTESVNIVLWRTFADVPSDSFMFTIDDNFGDHIPVEVSGAKNLPSPHSIAESLRIELGHNPTLQDVLTVTNPDGRPPSAGSYVAAAAILSSAGNTADALKAIEKAQSSDTRLKNEPSIQLQSGALRLVSGDSVGALDQLRSSQSSPNTQIADTSRWLSGIVLLKTGHPREAASYICDSRERNAMANTRVFGIDADENFRIDVQNAQESPDCAAKISKIRPAIEKNDARHVIIMKNDVIKERPLGDSRRGPV